MNIKLKTKIIKSGKPQIAIARKLKIPESHLSKIVGGWIDPKRELKEKIASILFCKVEDVF